MYKKLILIITILLIPATSSAKILTESSLDTSNFRKANFLEFFGFSKKFAGKIKHIFSFESVYSSLNFLNIFLSIIFILLILLLLFMLLKILSYSSVKGRFYTQIKVLPEALRKNYIGFFEKYCIREKDGTYTCSYSQHKKYSKFSRMSFFGAFGAIFFKIMIILLLILVDGGYLSAFSGRTGTNYTIFIDSQLAGGGVLSTANYSMDASFGEPIADNKGASGLSGYQDVSGFTSILDEPSIGLSYSNPSGLGFGVVSNASTSYGTHTITAYFNGNNGYDIVLQGNPPTDQNNNVITPIGSTPALSVAGTEQFGVNLTGNTSPAVIGSDPVGGHGAVTTNYSQTNKYAFNVGDVIATSTSRSSTTTYTATIIMNISNTTPAGSYSTNLIYTIVPKY